MGIFQTAVHLASFMDHMGIRYAFPADTGKKTYFTGLTETFSAAFQTDHGKDKLSCIKRIHHNHNQIRL